MDNMNDILILGIETSCDETSAAVVKNGRFVLSNEIFSQIDIHKAYGGVVPEIASRSHVEKIDMVVAAAMEKAGLTFADLDAIAVTYGPGLVGALLVGLNYAKGLSFSAGLPLVGVNHIRGHISANFIDTDLEPPFVCLVVSGGHTTLLHMDSYDKIEILGETRDDAAGEAFDKVARALDLPYPGGLMLDRLSVEGSVNIPFPQAFLEDGTLDFSFSGLKSAVLNYLNKMRLTNQPVNYADVAASFQNAVVSVLTAKTMQACERTGSNVLALAGGVSCNSGLRASITDACAKRGIKLYMPPTVLCTDNAAMIAAAGFYQYKRGAVSPLELNAAPRIEIL